MHPWSLLIGFGAGLVIGWGSFLALAARAYDKEPG